MTDGPFVRLYGGPLIVVAEGRPALTPAQRRLLAIVYLDSPDPVTREEVSWLLWEVGETAETRHRIRQLVYGINKDAPCPVIAREGDLLVPCLPSDCDHEKLSLSPPLRLVTPCGTTAFEHWLDTARERLARRRVNRLAAALDASAVAHDFEAICQTAEQLAGVEGGELGPEASLDLAWALQGLGRHREASLVLRRAMDSGVDGPFAAALHAVRRATPLIRGRSKRTPPLIGRTAVLENLLQMATSGSRGAVLYGPPAIGKSAILRETLREVSTRFPNRPVGWSFQNWSFAPEPFGLARTLLASDWLSDALAKNGTDPSPVLLVAFPDLARICDTRAPSVRIEPQPGAISRDLRDLLVRTLDGQSLVLFVDDLGTADASSATLIADLLADERVNAVLFSAVAAPNKNTLRVSLRNLDQRLEALEAVLVDELDQDGSNLLLREANSSLPADDARKIYRALGGVPGYLLAAAQGVSSAGGLPESVAEVADDHLSSLSACDRLLCSVLAVNGAPTQVAQLARVTQEPIHTVSGAVERLCDLSLLERGDGGVWFTQTFLATASYDRLSQGERTEFHRRFLADQQQQRTGSFALRRHTAATGTDTDSLHQALVSEAEDAEALGALREAVSLWNGAASTAGSHEKAGRALVRQVDALLRLRAYDLADEAMRNLPRSTRSQISDGLRASLDLRSFVVRVQADPGGVAVDDAHRVVSMLRRDGTALDLAIGLETGLRVADAKGDAAFARELLTVAQKMSTPDAEAATWLSLAATRHLYLGDPQQGLLSARKAVEHAEEVGKPGPLGRALNRLIVALVFRGRLASSEGRTVLARAREVAREFGDKRLLYDTYVNEGSWLMDTGELEAAEDAFAKGRDLLGSDQSKVESLTSRVNLGELLIHQGRGPRALEEFRAALDFAEGESTGALLCAAGMTLANLESGRLGKAKEWAQPLNGIDPSDRFRGNISLAALALARLAQAEGRPGRAVETLMHFGDQMMAWMVPASVKLYLEAFRLAIRIKKPLARDRVLPVLNAVHDLGIPGHGARILRLRDQLLQH